MEPWVDGVLRKAAVMRDSSDLVFEPLDSGALVARLRIAGVYADLDRAQPAGAAPAIARLKALAQVPAYITDEPQDGRIDGRLFGIPGDLRAAFLPTIRGCRAALRLPAIGVLPAPDALGLPQAALAGLRAAIRAPQGLVLVCGPTGSGKTTTIHSLLSELVSERPDRQVLAIEDPVERRLDGVVQVEVQAHRGYGFSEALRASLRQDPDILVIGEVRDPETAQATVRAALTGHLVITTLHCGRAAEALPRLLEMGVAPELLLPALSGVLAQRLLRATNEGRESARRVVADWASPDHAARIAWARGTALPLIADLDLQAAELVLSGRTDAAEVARAIGARS
jgi:type II secretory ATPase GspE/PulE/Tfp pilus assembly ATPase PilB-like protein